MTSLSKICNRCGVEKYELEFAPSQFKLRTGICRQCKKEYDKRYYIDNAESIMEYQKDYYKNNSEDVKEYNRKYRQINKETIRGKSRIRAITYRHSNIFVKIRRYISTIIGRTLKRNGSSKQGNSIMEFLPYTIPELKEHLEKQFQEPGNEWMNWDNYGKYSKKTWVDNDSTTWKWNIDHIIPRCALPFSSMTDDNFKKCWALENLRPYSAKRNIIDGAKEFKPKSRRKENII